jgi:hypothetical protein
LAMSYGIIRRHGGTIDVTSKINQGTTFIIHLPVFDEQDIPVYLQRETEAMQSLRVLVVDDHPTVRDIVSAYLAEDRHVVATAASAKGIDSILSSPTMRCQRPTARSWPLPLSILNRTNPSSC